MPKVPSSSQPRRQKRPSAKKKLSENAEATAQFLSAAAATSPLQHGKDVPETSTERIMRAITQAIVERRLMPGTKLGEQKLANIFHVSRTLVRQALMQLSRDKLVTLTPARGACVAQPSIEEARQVFEVRQMVETSVVARLARQITPEQVMVLREHLRQEQGAVHRTDVPGRTRLLADFHVLMAQMLGNEALAQMLSDLVSRSSLISLMYQSAMSAEESSDEHVGIVDALEKHDARQAVKLLLAHITHVEHNLHTDPRLTERMPSSESAH